MEYTVTDGTERTVYKHMRRGVYQFDGCPAKVMLVMIENELEVFLLEDGHVEIAIYEVRRYLREQGYADNSSIVGVYTRND